MTDTKEIWKDIEGYEGLYQVSNLGRVKSFVGRCGKKRELLLNGTVNVYGYRSVALYKNGVAKIKPVHRLVANAFILNPNNKPTVNHIDGDKLNNFVTNLEWATPKEQTEHALKNNLIHIQYGEKASNAKIKDSDIMQIREEYKPYSREHSTYALAKKYGVGADAIHRIVKRKTFKHIK